MYGFVVCLFFKFLVFLLLQHEFFLAASVVGHSCFAVRSVILRRFGLGSSVLSALRVTEFSFEVGHLERRREGVGSAAPFHRGEDVGSRNPIGGGWPEKSPLREPWTSDP